MMGDIEVSDRDWLVLKNEEHVGSFLNDFISACLHADDDNWEILLPALKRIREKYPLKKKRLEESHGQ